jgi:2-oxoacid dehydrogenases acyltransferase (catalytic domain)
VAANQGEGDSNQTDRTARLFTAVPGLVLRGLMWLLRALDFHGLLPRAIHRASPFHATAFVTDLGSLGIKPIYHHLYDFGTVSFFFAFGAKEREHVLAADGQVELRKAIAIKVVNDERICDGHYYASAFKYLRALLRRPELLEAPPERVIEDQD